MVLTGCCWGAWGQPEPKGIYYVLHNQIGRNNILNSDQWLTGCEELDKSRPTVLIFKPDSPLINQFKECLPGAAGELHLDQLGQKMFYSIVAK